MTELNWITTRDGGVAAPGEVFTYRVHVTGWGRIKLARIDRAVSAYDDVSAIIAEIMRTTADLGTWPRGRLRAGIEQAKAWAQQFEDGQSLPGQPEWQQKAPDRVQLGADYLQILADERQADEGLAPTYADEGLSPGTDATPEHLAMTGPHLREHLDASPAAQPVRGHGVPRLAEQAVAGHHGDGDPLRDLHVRRHTYNRPEDWT
jgi:hypothetical protein